jgi:hypothetical protein
MQGKQTGNADISDPRIVSFLSLRPDIRSGDRG